MFMLYHACSYPANIGEAIDPNLIMTEGLAALTQPFTDSITTSRLVSCEWVKPMCLHVTGHLSILVYTL